MNFKILKFRIPLLFLLLSFSISFAFGQEVYESKQFGIKILKPKNWILATNEVVENSIKNFDFNDEQLVKIINSNKGVVSLCTYHKYRIDSVFGFIPTVKVMIRNNPTSNDQEFKKAMIESTDRIKTVVQNFTFINNFKELKIDNYNSLFYSCRYSLTSATGEIMNIRTRYYMIPKGSYFISISLMDNETNEDNSRVFDEIIKSIQLTK